MEPKEHPPGPGRLARWVPIASWLPRYQRGWLAGDAIAGFTIWGLLIPEMIAYASLAGLPPQAGLYTLLASLALYAVFGTSRQLVVAGTSASAILVFSAVTRWIGSIPTGLPSVSWPQLKLDDLWVLLPSRPAPACSAGWPAAAACPSQRSTTARGRGPSYRRSSRPR